MSFSGKLSWLLSRATKRPGSSPRSNIFDIAEEVLCTEGFTPCSEAAWSFCLAQVLSLQCQRAITGSEHKKHNRTDIFFSREVIQLSESFFCFYLWEKQMAVFSCLKLKFPRSSWQSAAARYLRPCAAPHIPSSLNSLRFTRGQRHWKASRARNCD